MAYRKTECAKGHNDWYVNEKTGYRQCRICLYERNARRDRSKQPQIAYWAGWRIRDRGPRFEAFTYSEIMSARGYVDSQV